MKDENLYWVEVLFFCKRRDWSPLLQKNLMSFLFLAYIKRSPCIYIIEFGYATEDKIKLSILTSQGSMAVMIDVMKDHFDNYLPIKEKSIKYHLYEQAIMDSKIIQKFEINRELSSTIIEFFTEEEEVNDESILIFTFYLVSALSKALIDICPECLSDLNLNFQKEALISSEHDLDMNSLFDENKMILEDIVGEVFSSSNHWISNWYSACKSSLSNAEDSGNSIFDLTRVFNRIYYTIQKQLGIASGMSMIVNYFTMKTCQYIIDKDCFKNYV